MLSILCWRTEAWFRQSYGRVFLQKYLSCLENACNEVLQEDAFLLQIKWYWPPPWHPSPWWEALLSSLPPIRVPVLRKKKLVLFLILSNTLLNIDVLTFSDALGISWINTHETLILQLHHFMLHSTYAGVIQRPYHIFSVCFLSTTQTHILSSVGFFKDKWAILDSVAYH